MSTRRLAYSSESTEPPIAELPHLRRVSMAERPDPKLRLLVRRRLLANLETTSHPLRRRRKQWPVLFKAFLVPFSITVAVSSALASTAQGGRFFLEVRKVISSVVSVPTSPEDAPAPRTHGTPRRAGRDAALGAVPVAAPPAESAVGASSEPTTAAPELPTSAATSARHIGEDPAISSLTAASAATLEASPSVFATTIAAERHLLQVARLALARGETEWVLETVALYKSRFPQGVLGQEAREIEARARELNATTNLSRKKE